MFVAYIAVVFDWDTNHDPLERKYLDLVLTDNMNNKTLNLPGYQTEMLIWTDRKHD